MKLKKSQIYTLKGLLEELKKMKAKPKFHYGIIKNLKEINPELEVLEEVRESLQVAGWNKYLEKENNLILEYCEKDENGKPVKLNDRTFKLVEETKEEFHQSKKELDEENKELIEKYKNNQEEFNNILNEEFEFTPWEIDIDIFPELPEDTAGDITEFLMDLGIIK